MLSQNNLCKSIHMFISWAFVIIDMNWNMASQKTHGNKLEIACSLTATFCDPSRRYWFYKAMHLLLLDPEPSWLLMVNERIIHIKPCGV